VGLYTELFYAIIPTLFLCFLLICYLVTFLMFLFLLAYIAYTRYPYTDSMIEVSNHVAVILAFLQVTQNNDISLNLTSCCCCWEFL